MTQQSLGKLCCIIYAFEYFGKACDLSGIIFALWIRLSFLWFSILFVMWRAAYSK